MSASNPVNSRLPMKKHTKNMMILTDVLIHTSDPIIPDRKENEQKSPAI